MPYMLPFPFSLFSHFLLRTVAVWQQCAALALPLSIHFQMEQLRIFLVVLAPRMGRIRPHHWLH